MKRVWKTSRREIALDRPLVMGILNVTPDSFSDGGRFADVDAAMMRAEEMISEGVDIIDIGGESTRPGSAPVAPEVEVKRTLPIVEAIAKRFDIPLSIDTTKHLVARACVESGAEIINDISGLRWDESLADVAASFGAGLVLMHSRGEFASMHSQPPVEEIFEEVISKLSQSVALAKARGVADEQIVLDVGIGFGKTADQNLELIYSLDTIIYATRRYPMLVGTSRKSFLKKIVAETTPLERLEGSLATARRAVDKGAAIVRVHDVKETVAAFKVSSVALGPVSGI